MKEALITRRSASGYSVFVVAMLICWSAQVAAYPKWQSAEGAGDYCSACHGQFVTGEYFSYKDGSQWQTNLMDGHLQFVSNCGTCHLGTRDFGRVWLNQSDFNDRPKGCVGCHGRDEDVTDSCTGLSGGLDGIEVNCGSGAGLRQRHFRRISECADCHADADPAAFTTVGEDVLPFNYGQTGVDPLDSCNADLSESQFGPTGLDNDGDTLDDGIDPDCGQGIDSDQDGINDDLDNCTDAANPGQQDADGDGHGNLCDADFNNDCSTNFSDLSTMKSGFFSVDEELDLDSSGSVNFADLAIMKELFFQDPGPSAPGSFCNPVGQ